MTHPNHLSAFLLILLTISPSQAGEPSSNPSAKFIQRTMRSLVGERNAGEKISILFYGQSITAQRWRNHVVADLQKRFPEANLEIQNRAERPNGTTTHRDNRDNENHCESTD